MFWTVLQLLNVSLDVDDLAVLGRVLVLVDEYYALVLLQHPEARRVIAGLLGCHPRLLALLEVRLEDVLAHRVVSVVRVVSAGVGGSNWYTLWYLGSAIAVDLSAPTPNFLVFW